MQIVCCCLKYYGTAWLNMFLVNLQIKKETLLLRKEKKCFFFVTYYLQEFLNRKMFCYLTENWSLNKKYWSCWFRFLKDKKTFVLILKQNAHLIKWHFFATIWSVIRFKAFIILVEKQIFNFFLIRTNLEIFWILMINNLKSFQF